MTLTVVLADIKVDSNKYLKKYVPWHILHVVLLHIQIPLTSCFDPIQIKAGGHFNGIQLRQREAKV